MPLEGDKATATVSILLDLAGRILFTVHGLQLGLYPPADPVARLQVISLNPICCPIPSVFHPAISSAANSCPL